MVRKPTTNRCCLATAQLKRDGSSRIRSTGEDISALLDAYALHRSLLRRHDRDALRRSVEQGAVLVSDPAVLLELLCTFRLLDSLRSLGWEVEPFGLRRVGELRLTARKET